jgi:uncharacterized protein (DUF983 family)
MAPGRITSEREHDRISALAAGLAATVIGWIFVAAFMPGELESLSGYSPWLYGPVAMAVWVLFSTIAYLLISRDRRKRPSLDQHEDYHCREFAPAKSDDHCTVCANQEEKIRLGAVTAGFALTISGWVAALSFMPAVWFDRLGEAQPWVYCIVSIILWAALSKGMYLVFRASRERSR